MSQAFYITKAEVDKLVQGGLLCRERVNYFRRRVEWEDAEEVRIPLRQILDVNGPKDALHVLFVMVHIWIGSIPPDVVDQAHSIRTEVRRLRMEGIPAKEALKRALKGVKR